MQKITIKLSKYIWEVLGDAFVKIEQSIDEVSVNDKLIALTIHELYISKYTFFVFWRPNKKKQMILKITPAQALALHYLLSDKDFYNMFIRTAIEPFIIKYLP